MSQVIVINSVTLDGVMQGPGRPEEDTRGGFWNSQDHPLKDGMNNAVKYVASNDVARSGALAEHEIATR